MVVGVGSSAGGGSQDAMRRWRLAFATVKRAGMISDGGGGKREGIEGGGGSVVGEEEGDGAVLACSGYLPVACTGMLE